MLDLLPIWVYHCWKEKLPVKEWFKGPGGLLSLCLSGFLVVLIAAAILPPPKWVRQEQEVDRYLDKMGIPHAHHSYGWFRDIFWKNQPSK